MDDGEGGGTVIAGGAADGVFSEAAVTMLAASPLFNCFRRTDLYDLAP